MSSRLGREVHETRLVIGLDYGTTFTGVAYATPSGTQCDIQEIDVIVEWGAVMDDKVPSVISYSEPGKITWGGYINEKATSMVHTKLELGLQHVTGELDLTLQMLDGMRNLNFGEILSNGVNGTPAYSPKNPEEIVTDYLTLVFKYLEKEVEKFGEVARKYTTTDLVVTVPTEWSYMAMNSTFRALMKAGFNRNNFPRLQDVMFITEPEAAVQYTARHYRDEELHEFLEENQYFILCDAGGGTVDVVSYQVKALRPSLQLQQIGSPTGNKSGSIFINHEFKKWLRLWLGDDNYRKLDPNMDIKKSITQVSENGPMRSLMKEFDIKKREFGWPSTDCQIELPPPLENVTVHDRINQGLLTIKSHEMESFFDASVEQIAKLIKGHVRRIREQCKGRPKHLFLVGGYGESQYLQNQLKTMLDVEESTMEFRQPRKSWTAVVRGAVVCGIEKSDNPSLRRTNACQNSYGICLSESFSDAHHSLQDICEVGGTYQAQDQLTWMLSKGDLVLEGKPTRREKTFKIRLEKFRQDTMKLKIWKNLADEKFRPTRLADATTELQNVAELDIEFSRIQFERGRMGRFSKTAKYEATVKVVLELDWDLLCASFWFNDEMLSKTQITYP